MYDIKLLREQMGVSRERFARTLGVSTMTVYRWEKGVTKPSLMAMERIQHLVNVNKEAPR